MVAEVLHHRLPDGEVECEIEKAYLNGLSDKGRAAARVGRPDGAAAQNGSQDAYAVSDSVNTDMAAAATQQPRRRRGLAYVVVNASGCISLVFSLEWGGV
ncbi:MAG: hypothetical protein FRX49_04033 [Trebouxia sp. A1-2]|nr:MAG: hypothetical protein FRX49_04033 [Trebouxia sp. A1-2]